MSLVSQPRPMPVAGDSSSAEPPLLDVSVVVPTRNAGALLEACLESIVANRPREIIVVDGRSDDATVEIAERFGATVASDEGRGLPVARYLGAKMATSSTVALIDADVVLPDGALAALLDEFVQGRFAALQAGQRSVSGPGYWGQALVFHHRTGRSKKWFGLVATLFDREVLLTYGFDEDFLSGEDIEMRWRLAAAGQKIGVSERTVVTHRYAGDSLDFALDQFRADGEGLARMVRKHGWRGARLILLPAAAAARGMAISLARRQPKWIPYFVVFAVMNYKAMLSVLLRPNRRRTARRRPGLRRRS